MQDLSVLYLCSIYKLLYFIIIIIIIIITDQFRWIRFHFHLTERG